MPDTRPFTATVDLAVAPEALAATVGRWDRPALLESGPGFGPAGGWSVYAAEPRWVFEAVGDRWRVGNPEDEQASGAGDPLAALDRLLRSLDLDDPRDAPGPDECPFSGGLIGFLGYDVAPWIERLPRRSPRDTRLPDIRLGFYDTAAVVDHRDGTARVTSFASAGESRGDVEERCYDWSRRLRRQAVRGVERSGSGKVRALSTRADHERNVRRALDYIAAGDVFQVNLSQRFEATGRFDPLDLSMRLKARSPAPFACFLAWDDLAVVGSSPEWFYSTRGGVIVTRPIKGTRPRSPDPLEDARLSAELADSAKDRAELTMIVDLERNDLGRVCDYGTVRVVESHRIESFAQVHHLVATVDGRLRAGVGTVDVVRAVFPGGSITGAPKVRAMQIIDELEPSRRGLYTGSVGYLGRGGSSAFNIAIRTIVVEGDRATYQVGGGIVADSDPAEEFEETLDKGRALRDVLEGAP